MFENDHPPPNLAALATCSREQLVLRFEQDFDLPFLHHVGVGLLEAQGALSEECRAAEPGVAVGAHWARILRADVEYELLRGLEAIADSRSLVDDLLVRPQLRTIDAYALARWHDAAGRIQFRCGDMMAARIAFAAADELAEAHSLWWCHPDIRSNLLRAGFDEHEKAGDQRDLADEAQTFDALLAECLDQARDRGLRLDLAVLGELLDRWLADGRVDGRDQCLDDRLGDQLGIDADSEPRRQREFLRGLSNVLHNVGIVYMPNRRQGWAGDESRSDELARSSAAIALLLRDEYRLAQALRHRVNLATAVGRATPEVMRWLALVRDHLHWRRGRWMATQALARAEPSLEAVSRLQQLLADLERRRDLRGEEIGFDVDVYRYTLEALEFVRDRLGITQDEDFRIHERRLASASSVRRVVKVATYRSRFAQVVYPVYLNEIERLRRRALDDDNRVEALEDLFARIEETSARDLLDTLVDASRVGVSYQDHQPLASEAAEVAERTGSFRAAARRCAGTEDAAYQAVGAARRRFEETALQRPMSATTHDTEVAVALRRLTAAQPGLLVVRYFGSGWKSSQPESLHALVVQNGQMDMVSLEAARVRALAIAASGKPPTPAIGHELWELLIAPIWSWVGDSLEHMVLIPAPGMFGLPLHVATPDADRIPPLAARVQLSFSVSATAFVTHRRYLLRSQPRDPSDDLCALVPERRGLYPGELEHVPWRKESFHLAGSRPDRLRPDQFTFWGRGDRQGLERLLATRAELFVFAGHGVSIVGSDGVEVALRLANGAFLTQYDLVSDLRMQRNKWTVLGACVSGLGGDSASGEVAGFIRSFIAAGAGALVVTLWPVADDTMQHVVGQLLRRIAVSHDLPFDIVGEIHAIQRSCLPQNVESSLTREFTVEDDIEPTDHTNRLLACPLALYL